MSLRSLCLCTLLLRFHPIFGPHALAASDEAPGKLNLYDDFNCDHPSTLKPTVTLPVSTCLITTGGEGLVIDELPACSQGNATLIYYSDTACGVQTNDVSTSIVASSCIQLAAGTDIYNANAVMFSCQPAANNPQPSSTTTAVVSALAAVATGSTESNGSGSGSSSPSSTSTAGSVPTDTSTLKNSTSSGGSNSNDGTSTSTSTGSGSDSGLDTGDKIALAVGLGIGIPTILIMLAAWLFPDFRNQLRRRLPSRLDQLAFQRNEAHQWHYNGTQGMYSRQQPSHAY